MLGLISVLLVCTIMFALLGFGALASVGAAKILFVVFLLLFMWTIAKYWATRQNR